MKVIEKKERKNMSTEGNETNNKVSTNRESNQNESKIYTDEEFELSVNDMIHDYDDDSTLQTDENFMSSCENELNELEKDCEVPLEELLKTYSIMQQQYEEGLLNWNNVDQNLNNHETRNTDINPENNNKEYDDESDHKPYWMNEIKIGTDYQATIPVKCSLSSNYGYDDSSELLWNPNDCSESVLNEYITKLTAFSEFSSMKNEEQILYHFAKNNMNIKDAVDSRYMLLLELNNKTINWTVEDIEKFEQGFIIYKKKFHKIHAEFLNHKILYDIINFYYDWKKSQRFKHIHEMIIQDHLKLLESSIMD